MNQELLDRLGRVTEEEQRILDGTAGIEKSYMPPGRNSPLIMRSCWRPVS